MESPSAKQELTSLDSNHRSFSFIAILSAGMLVFTAFSFYQDWDITLFSFVLTIILSLVGIIDTVEKNKVGKRLSLLVLFLCLAAIILPVILLILFTMAIGQ
ncbi:hypothetical protein HXA31_06665 [Salipaludibacillus agaradhaerens]|uniref:Uncharacterized protein n=1 Tax=Salipaludibacillus agaradhaerens TaxID=76935 RepID=A0A9Q4B116_SALAG|nr:hypothetical protein [Salipaludibacillus agaradhaerens]MCR6096398.1 hypothetical protein [Salipaludibacillus agaradhaerens]MCR6114043.1 hypothetical protein [Salipaludibacillus agaradhaerens]